MRLGFCAQLIKQRLGLSDEETVEQIRENACMQFSHGFAGYCSKAPFHPSMMVHLLRLSEDDLKLKTNLLRSAVRPWLSRLWHHLQMLTTLAIQTNAGNQLTIDDFVKPADWTEGHNWGTLSFDASCTLADNIYPTDLKLLNEEVNRAHH